MDYPLSQPNLDLYQGRFTDGVPGLRPASVIPSVTMNALVDEISAVIVAAGLVPEEATVTQLRDAIIAMVEERIGVFSLSDGGSLVGLSQLGIGSIVRTALEKFRESPSLSDFATVQAAIDASESLLAPAGSFNLTAIPTNKFGTPIDGPGALMVPVDPSNLAKGLYRYTYPETDAHQRTFGEEYLYALHDQWKFLSRSAGAAPTIYLDGDSTIYGDYITDPAYLPHNAITIALQQLGLDVTVVNRAVSGSTISQFHLSDAEINSANCIIISFGINDTAGITAFVDSYRAVLTRIRALRTYMQTSVVIKVSNAVGDTQHARDETQAHAQRQALRQAARDYQCFFFDTAAFIADSRPPASGTWNDAVNPSVKLTAGWMDDPFRSDVNFHDPLSFGCTVHPLEIGQAWIWGRMADALVTPGVRKWRTNSLHNTNDETVQAAYSATVFPKGIQIQRANSVNGFPIDGEIATVVGNNRTSLQVLFGYDTASPNMALRQHNINTGLWTEWVFLTPQSVALAPLASWVPFLVGFDPVARKTSSRVTFGGALKSGVMTKGTVIVTLPVGYRPSISKWFTVPCGGNMDQLAVITILANGQVIIQSCPVNTGLALDGITFDAFN